MKDRNITKQQNVKVIYISAETILYK